MPDVGFKHNGTDNDIEEDKRRRHDKQELINSSSPSTFPLGYHPSQYHVHLQQCYLSTVPSFSSPFFAPLMEEDAAMDLVGLSCLSLNIYIYTQKKFLEAHCQDLPHLSINHQKKRM